MVRQDLRDGLASPGKKKAFDSLWYETLRRPDLLAERVGWSHRDRASGFAAAPVEQDPKTHTALAQETEKPHKGAFLFPGGEGGIDSLASRAHPCEAHCVRPKSLRDFVEQGSLP